MVKKVSEYMQKHHMLKKGDTVIVGVSGGADSVCLLSVLCELRTTMEITLVAAHINHLFRETAERDEKYVEDLCKEMNVPCKILREDVKTVAKEQGMTFEEAGRQVRYKFFRQLKEEYQADKIAVAHNREDCGETMLFHLFRGSNLKGLGGISPVSGDVIRPLMKVGRKEIEGYLNGQNREWMEDETNASEVYSRNRIRHQIMPVAEELCAGAGERMAETAEELRLTENYLAEQTGQANLKCCEKRDGGTFINVTKLEELHPVLQSRLLFYVLEQEAEASKDLGRIHVQQLLKLCHLQAGRSINLPYRICAYRTAEGILVRREDSEGIGQGTYFDTQSKRDGTSYTLGGVSSVIALLSGKELEAGEEIHFVLEGLGSVRAKLLFNYELKNIPQKTYTKWFDYDKIVKCAVFRKRMEGDYLVIDDKGSRKKLKEYFIQEKIPAYKRDEVWILADEEHIMWVPGYRISTHYKITETTERVLEITIGGNENG